MAINTGNIEQLVQRLQTALVSVKVTPEQHAELLDLQTQLDVALASLDVDMNKCLAEFRKSAADIGNKLREVDVEIEQPDGAEVDQEVDQEGNQPTEQPSDRPSE